MDTDYVKPFIIKNRKRRRCKTYKVYIHLFNHQGYTFEIGIRSYFLPLNFILTLRRFVSQRGTWKFYPTTVPIFWELIQSWNGLENFVVENKNALQKPLVLERINWSFIPAYSSHLKAFEIEHKVLEALYWPSKSFTVFIGIDWRYLKL